MKIVTMGRFVCPISFHSKLGLLLDELIGCTLFHAGNSYLRRFLAKIFIFMHGNHATFFSCMKPLVRVASLKVHGSNEFDRKAIRGLTRCSKSE